MFEPPGKSWIHHWNDTCDRTFGFNFHEKGLMGFVNVFHQQQAERDFIHVCQVELLAQSVQGNYWLVPKFSATCCAWIWPKFRHNNIQTRQVSCVNVRGIPPRLHNHPGSVCGCSGTPCPGRGDPRPRLGSPFPPPPPTPTEPRAEPWTRPVAGLLNEVNEWYCLQIPPERIWDQGPVKGPGTRGWGTPPPPVVNKLKALSFVNLWM